MNVQAETRNIDVAQVRQPPERADSTRHVRLWFVLLLLPLVAVAAFAVFQPVQVLPRIELAPGFSFVDQHGGQLTNEDMRGRMVLYTFTHSDCGEGCPQTGPAMQQLRQALSEVDTDGIPMEYVTISFDPERDTPERLATFAAELGGESDDWHFVTGDATRLKNVIGRGFGAYYERRAEGGFVQDPMFVLVDGWGIQRAKYRTQQPDIERVRRDVGLLVTEARNRDGASRVVYEAAHLFLCYPE